MTSISQDGVNPPSREINEDNKEKTKKWISAHLTSICICGTFLDKCKGIEPYSEDYLICPLCDSTYLDKT